MALIKCVECGKEYSDKAEACPKCSCPTNAQITKEKVEKVKPEFEPEVLEDEEETKETKKQTVGSVIRRTIATLFVIGLIVNSNIQTSQRKGEVDEELMIYQTPGDARLACWTWVVNEYKNHELIIFATENNLRLDRISINKSSDYTYYISRYLCSTNNISREIEAKGFTWHYEYFGSWDWGIFGSAATNAEARVKELRDELGIDPAMIEIYRPSRPGFDPEECESRSWGDIRREETSKTYCPSSINRNFQYDEQYNTSRRWNGIDLYIRKNELYEEDSLVVWSDVTYDDGTWSWKDTEPVKVFPYY